MGLSHNDAKNKGSHSSVKTLILSREGYLGIADVY